MTGKETFMTSEYRTFKLQDVEEGLKFFGRIPGIKVNFRFQYDGLRLAILEAGKQCIEIWEDKGGERPKDFNPADENPSCSLTVPVRRLKSLLAEMRSGGYEIAYEEPEPSKGTKEAVVIGPDNIRIQFLERNMMNSIKGFLKPGRLNKWFLTQQIFSPSCVKNPHP